MHETPPTVAQTYAASKTTDKKRKRRPNWKALLFVVIFFGGALLAVFLQSPLSAVSKIDVKGNHQIRYEDILRTSGISTGMSFWKINKTQAADQIIKTFPLVESANVQVSWTGEVVIAIVEKQEAGTLISKGHLYTILQDGSVVDASKKTDNGTLLITMDNPPAVQAGQKTTDQDLLTLAKQIPEVDRKVLDGISEVHITKSGPWRIFMRDKFEVRVPARQFADKMKGYDKFRSALSPDVAPGIINLLDSNWLEKYKNEPTK